MNFRDWITINQRTGTTLTTGEIADSWVLFMSIAADMKAKTGTDNIQGEQMIGITTYTFRTRYIPGVEYGMRIEHRGLVYDVNAVIPDQINNLLTIECNLRDNQ